jgi:hypothetical protein
VNYGKSTTNFTNIRESFYSITKDKSISATLDLGMGLTVTGFETAITDLRSKLDNYNQELALVNEKQAALKTGEKNLADLSERMLAGVAAKYGKNSPEYVQAGGKRKSDIKRSPHKSPSNPPIKSQPSE